MYKKKLFCVILGVVCVISMGCNGSNVSENAGSTAYNTNISLGDQTSLDVTQPYMDTGVHSVAKGQTGYYYIRSYIESGTMDNYLTYYDPVQKQSIKLCDKADCKHNDSSCMAYLGMGQYMQCIYYYKDYLYLLKVDMGNAVLVRIKPDGSSREDLGIICTTSGDNDIRLTFCGDSVYAINTAEKSSNEKIMRIYRFSMTDNTSQVAYEYKGPGANIKHLRSYGNKVYFNEYEITKDDSTGGNSVMSGQGLMSIDNDTQQVETVIDQDVSDYSIDMDHQIVYYYVNNDGLYKNDLQNQTIVKLADATVATAWCEMSFDGTYLYVDNMTWSKWGRAFGGVKDKIVPECTVYNSAGETISEINMEDVVSLFYGDANYLFAEVDANEPNLSYIDKKNLTDAQWKPLGEDEVGK